MTQQRTRIILGIDPGLQNTGWGVIRVLDNRMQFVACGVIKSVASQALSKRLSDLFNGLQDIIKTYDPSEAAVEETFVNKNPASALKLGHARGIALLAPAHAGLMVSEYTANQVKKSVVGAGHADKNQVLFMVKRLLPTAEVTSLDAADALAIAICHGHAGSAHYLQGAQQ